MLGVLQMGLCAKIGSEMLFDNNKCIDSRTIGETGSICLGEVVSIVLFNIFFRRDSSLEL